MQEFNSGKLAAVPCWLKPSLSTSHHRYCFEGVIAISRAGMNDRSGTAFLCTGGGRLPALRGRYEKFCQEYAVDYNGTQAAIRAGYEEKSARQQASRLLSQECVIKRIMELQAEQVKRLAITQDYVVMQLLDTYKCCRDATPVMQYDHSLGEMVETGTYQFDSKGALRALELLGKHLGMYGPKSTDTGKNEDQLHKARDLLEGVDSVID